MHGRKLIFVALLAALFAAGIAAALVAADSRASTTHRSGCHAVHSCQSDHHTYVWYDPNTGQGWDCAEPGAPEYNPSLDTTTIVWEGLTYYCRAAGSPPPPTTAPPPTTTSAPPPTTASTMTATTAPVTTTAPATTSTASACGIERWAVKTLSDPAASLVNYSPVNTSVDALRSLPAPGVSSSTPRITGAETTTYSVTVRLVEMRLEDDRDIHLVVADPTSGGTMIVEFPDPQCSGVSTSAHLPEMAAARSALVAAEGMPNSSSFTALSGTASITGVGFFDELHGQTGVAPNGIELHPALSFSTGGATTSTSTSTSTTETTGVTSTSSVPPTPPTPPTPERASTSSLSLVRWSTTRINHMLAETALVRVCGGPPEHLRVIEREGRLHTARTLSFTRTVWAETACARVSLAWRFRPVRANDFYRLTVSARDSMGAVSVPIVISHVR